MTLKCGPVERHVRHSRSRCRVPRRRYGDERTLPTSRPGMDSTLRLLVWSPRRRSTHAPGLPTALRGLPSRSTGGGAGRPERGADRPERPRTTSPTSTLALHRLAGHISGPITSDPTPPLTPRDGRRPRQHRQRANDGRNVETAAHRAGDREVYPGCGSGSPGDVSLGLSGRPGRYIHRQSHNK